MDKELLLFSHDLQQLILTGEDTTHEDSQEDLFTEFMMNTADDPILEYGTVCSYRGYGIKVNGFTSTDDDETLGLFVSHYTAISPPQSVRKNDIDLGFKRLFAFLTKSLDQSHATIPPQTPVHDLASHIHEVRDKIKRIHLYFFTDGIVRREDNFPETTIHDNIRVIHHIWDIERVYRSKMSGRTRDVIEVNFEEMGDPVPCLPMHEANSVYMSYLAIIPGELLASIYGEYGSRLMERNVRAFLQVRGNVNKGIRTTIKDEPHMFLAYNNGLSAVAQNVETVQLPNGGLGIRKIIDLQIVNGGQTTASIYNTFQKDNISLKGVNVQIKITVVLDPAKLDEIVPMISRYANDQNKIQTADFSANDPFHRKIEELSRTIWAPTAQGSIRQTRWYYERARGQYMDDRSRENTSSYRKKFDATHPKSQMFTKTDLAKYQNTWNQLPYFVSRGAQKNFNEFILWVSRNKQPLPDQLYFEDLISTAIIFKKSEKIVQELKYGGYRANIVTYTLALISYLTEQRVDLTKVWREQDISPAFREAIAEVSKVVQRHIVNPPSGGNITEWCKKKECWEELRKVEIKLPDDFVAELTEPVIVGI